MNGDSTTTDEAAPGSAGKGQARGLLELVGIVAFAVALALGVQAAVAKPYTIPSGSMKPTLAIGERVIVDRVSYRFGPPEIGDVVVFNPPVGADSDYHRRACGVRRRPGQACPTELAERSDQTFIKRIVAGPGDRLYIEDGHPVVNGVRANESFTRPCGGGMQCNLTEEITVPEDHFFLMGDNRGQSEDSRFWGPVPRDWIIGRAVVSYWPPNRIGTL